MTRDQANRYIAAVERAAAALARDVGIDPAEVRLEVTVRLDPDPERVTINLVKVDPA